MFTQGVGLLCEHDLIPVLGFPRPAIGVGDAKGSVTTSFLVREVDILVPGSLLMLSKGEGCAPNESCPFVTVASEMERLVGTERRYKRPAEHRGVADTVGVGEATRVSANRLEGSDIASSCNSTRLQGDTLLQGEVAASVTDGEELLVEVMCAETGLCLSKRVPVGELRHSTSFFGQELDSEGTTVNQVCGVQFPRVTDCIYEHSTTKPGRN